LAASTACHTVAEARLTQVRSKLEAISRQDRSIEVIPKSVHLKAEERILSIRRKEQQLNVFVHDDDVRSGSKQYTKLAARISKADPEVCLSVKLSAFTCQTYINRLHHIQWIARFLEKGNLELLASKLLAMLERTLPAEQDSYENDELKTADAIMLCIFSCATGRSTTCHMLLGKLDASFV
jgi:hypothetical protein